MSTLVSLRHTSIVSALVLSACVGAFASLLFGSDAFRPVLAPLLVVSIALLLIIATAIAFAKERALSLLNPALALFAYLALLYVLRPAYVLALGIAGTATVGEVYLSANLGEATYTLLVLVAALGCFTVAFFFAPRQVVARYLAVPRRRAPQRGNLVLAVLLIGAAALGAETIASLASFPGGWQTALTVRNQFFGGRTILVWGMEGYKLGFLCWLALELLGRPTVSRRFILLAISLWLPAMLFDALSGSRAELLLRNVVPTAVIVLARTRERFPWVLSGALVVLVVSTFVAYRTVVRTPAYPGQADTPALAAIAANLSDLGGFLLSGDELAGFDFLLITRIEIPAYSAFRGAETVEVLLAAPIPRAWFPNKPERAAHELTARLRPSLFGRGVDPAFSGAADLYFTGGDGAVILGFGLLGLLSGALIGGATRAARVGADKAWPLLFGYLATAAMISVIRADLLELAFLPVRLGMLVAIYQLMSTRVDGQVFAAVQSSSARPTNNNLQRDPV